MPGLDVKPLLDELRDRVAEELDYQLEAASQQAFADAYAGDPDIYVPDVVMGTDHVLVTEWMDGTPLAKIISDGSKEERDRAGILLVRFLFSGPARAGLLHADPHPGNFRLLDDGRLGVLDFGAVDRLPDGLPPFFGRLLRIMHDDDADIERGGARAARARVPAARHRRGPGRAARLPGAAGRAVQGGLRSSSAASGCAARPPGSPTCAPATSPASSTCRRRTCSSTACPRRASACCASWSARASSGPRCSGGCRATSIRYRLGLRDYHLAGTIAARYPSDPGAAMTGPAQQASVTDTAARRRIVVGVDDSQPARNALAWAQFMALALDAEIDAIAAWEIHAVEAVEWSDDMHPENETTAQLHTIVTDVLGAQPLVTVTQDHRPRQRG